jgi:hypothetical protein
MLIKDVQKDRQGRARWCATPYHGALLVRGYALAGASEGSVGLLLSSFQGHLLSARTNVRPASTRPRAPG